MLEYPDTQYTLMNDCYYYIVSLLPYLHFDKLSPITVERFFEEIGKWLIAKDLTILKNINIRDFEIKESDIPLTREWKAFDAELKEELAKVRIAKLSDLHAKIPEFLMDIFEGPTPLEMEKSFEKKRWNFLSEKETEFNFDLNTIIIYLLKLQILERLAAFDKTIGSSVFENLCGVRYE